MLAEDIHKAANALIRIHGESPYDIAEGLGIKLIQNFDFKKLYGMYTVIKRKRIIILNGNLDDGLKKTVLAHELGHDRLHRELAVNRVVHDVMLYDMRLRPEYEANMFAAELLIRDDDIFELMRDYGYSAKQTAVRLGLSTALVTIKLTSMQLRGLEIPGVITPDAAMFKFGSPSGRAVREAD